MGREPRLNLCGCAGVGGDNTSLFGAMLIGRYAINAVGRDDLPRERRRQHVLVVDFAGSCPRGRSCARIRAAYWAALDGATSPAEAEAGLRVLVGELSSEYPSAAACLADDLGALTFHLRYPLRLRKRLRSTNLLERSLEEVCRRTGVIGRFPGETSCMTMAWAVMDLVNRGVPGPRPGAARPSRDRRHGRRPVRPADGGADRLTYPCRGACAVRAFQQIRDATTTSP